MRWASDPRIIGKTPLVTTALFGWSNVAQLYQMWTLRTAAGQSLCGWVSVGLALWLFVNFYRVCCPKERFVYYCTIGECLINLAVIATVIYFRYGGVG